MSEPSDLEEVFAKRLTDAEWRAMMPPFYWYKIEKEKGSVYERWGKMEFEFIIKWCHRHCSDWFYYNDAEEGRFVFREHSDLVLFKLWVTNNRMIEGGID